MLELCNLTCGYGDGFLLRDINISVADRELVGIIGPNGSGKTTLLRAATRLLKPREGRVLLQGRDLHGVPPRELATIVAVVSQNPAAASLTVEEFVLMGRIPHYGRFQFLETRHDRDIAERAMRLTDCLDLRDHSMSAISGGERQLALIARALAQEPRLLLLDEPTSFLDIAHQVQIMDLIQRLNRDIGLTVVTVLHDLNMASEYCHRLVLMNAGRIHKAGHPDEVIDYALIEEVYRTIVIVDKNPLSSKPYVLTVSQDQRQAGVRNGGEP